MLTRVLKRNFLQAMLAVALASSLGFSNPVQAEPVNKKESPTEKPELQKNGKVEKGSSSVPIKQVDLLAAGSDV